MPPYKIRVSIRAHDGSNDVLSTERVVQAGTLDDAYKPLKNALRDMRGFTPPETSDAA